jgi:hypothetical protein
MAVGSGGFGHAFHCALSPSRHALAGPILSASRRTARRLGILDLEPTVTATAHLQVGFRKGSPTSDANPRGEETCNVNFGSLSIVESVDLKLCVSRYIDRFRPNCE